MKTPVMSFRIPPERRDEMRRLVKLVKANEAAMKAALVAAQGLPADTPHDANRGPFASEAAALDFMVGQLVRGLRPLAIFLFGSRARGDFRPDSDFDLMVVTSERLSMFEAYAPVAGCRVEADVIPHQVDNFLKNCTEQGSMAYCADREGRLLYASIGGPFYKRFLAEKAAGAA